ncbi:capsular biosynthesis protein [Pseudomonas sp. JQ170]|uniref:capsular biosynthesis protein n=1 Tax=unclassified Pseudomonas TaxID=196821 RepID=UPI00265268E9|nr:MULTISPECIES: capsular biosynthesis protein [unclassified Pseudomonas]MDN7142942.1 capsular biosynthesis protein [Pseudomonas sp. JQ170]WRO74560.1 capsular biosynthesis protein [Pseudomonas sp. 170C]
MKTNNLKIGTHYNRLTTIIPVDLGFRALDILRKTINICKTNEKLGGSVVIGLADRRTLIDKIFISLARQFKRTIVVNVPTTGAVNTALLRNRAFEKAATEFLLILDADIWPDFELFNKYQRNIELGLAPFYFIPCMYLSAYGSKALLRDGDPEGMTEKYFNFSRKEFVHLANPSSITIMRSIDFINAGSFNEAFEGHGYEDFDFMLRLAVHYNVLTPCGKLLDTCNARSPLFPSGFRRALGRLCLPTLLEKDMAFHLFHPTPKNKSYHASRRSNLEIFKSLHGHLESSLPESRTLIEDFIGLCQKHDLNLRDYSALFEDKPGHIDRYDTFRRRLRFLFK